MYGKAASLWSADEGADPARYAFFYFSARDALGLVGLANVMD